MEVLETPHFRKIVKRLHANQKLCLNKAIKTISSNPGAGQKKWGDLPQLRVYKFQMVGQQTLLGYEYDEIQQHIILKAVGSHENFYRDIKRH